MSAITECMHVLQSYSHVYVQGLACTYMRNMSCMYGEHIIEFVQALVVFVDIGDVVRHRLFYGLVIRVEKYVGCAF